MKENKLLENFMSLIVIKGFDFVVPLITLPYLVVHLGLDKYGLINLALSLTVYFSSFIQFGFNLTTTKEIARNRSDQKTVEKHYSLTFFSSLYLTIISFIIFSSIIFSFDKFSQYYLVYFICFTSMIFRANLPVWVFQGYEQMKYITYLNLFSRFVFVFGMFLLIHNPSDYLYMPVLQAFSSLICFIASIILIKYQFGVFIRYQRINEIFNYIWKSRNIFISQFAPNLYSNSSVFILGVFSSNNVVGIFTAASKVIDVFGSFAYVVSNTFFPYIARNLQAHEKFKNIMFIAGIGLTITLLIFANFIATILFKSDSEVIATNIRYLSPAVLLIFIQLTYGSNFLILVGKDKIVKNIVLFFSVFSLSYSIPLIHEFNIYGSIANLIVTRILIVSFFIWFYLEFKKSNKNVKNG